MHEAFARTIKKRLNSHLRKFLEKVLFEEKKKHFQGKPQLSRKELNNLFLAAFFATISRFWFAGIKEAALPI